MPSPSKSPKPSWVNSSELTNSTPSKSSRVVSDISLARPEVPVYSKITLGEIGGIGLQK